MKRYTKSMVALLLAFIFIISSCLPIFAVDARAAGQPSSYSSSYNSGERDVVCTTLNGTSAASYYTGSYTYDNLSSLSASSLLSTLRTLMTSTHKKITSYSDCKNYSDNTDCENEDGRVVLLYTSYSATMSDWISGSTGWNREHVWPQSLGGFGTSQAGSDLHHIRPDDVDTNGDRGNKKFGEVSGGTVSYSSSKYGSSETKTGGTYNSTYFEPHDNVKGDVARICLYVYARWGGEFSKCSNITTVFQSVDVLLEWCELDPVDTWEMGRNEVVEDIQGNRNVFIDYPELAWLLFGKSIPSNMSTPSGKASGGSSSGGSTTCTHTSTTVKNATSATCGNAGYTGDTYCTSCGTKVKSGTTISATGNHSYGAWVENAASGTKTRTCSGCGKTETESFECPHPVTSVKNQSNATCGKAGYSGDTYCVACGVTVIYGESISATGIHSYNAWVINVEANTKTRSCYICGATETASAELENCMHSFTIVRNKLSATCSTDGYTGDVCCATCSQIITKGEIIAATGEHIYSEMVVITEPTLLKSGLGKQVCEGCGDEKLSLIPALSTDSNITAEELISCLESDSERILLLLVLGMSDRLLVEELSN